MQRILGRRPSRRLVHPPPRPDSIQLPLCEFGRECRRCKMVGISDCDGRRRRQIRGRCRSSAAPCTSRSPSIEIAAAKRRKQHTHETRKQWHQCVQLCAKQMREALRDEFVIKPYSKKTKAISGCDAMRRSQIRSPNAHRLLPHRESKNCNRN